MSNPVEDKVEQTKQLYQENKQAVSKEIGLGFVFGYSAGYFTKRVARAATFVNGGLFVTTQLISSSGYVNIEWNKIEQDMISALDQNNDGKLDEKDLAIMKDKFLTRLQYRLPSASGFLCAFALGWRGK